MSTASSANTARTPDQTIVEKETGRAIKQLLTLAEELAAMEPAKACHPYTFEKYREQMIRILWNNGKLWRRYGSGTL